jgi:hypothetical protein
LNGAVGDAGLEGVVDAECTAGCGARDGTLVTGFEGIGGAADSTAGTIAGAATTDSAGAETGAALARLELGFFAGSFASTSALIRERAAGFAAFALFGRATALRAGAALFFLAGLFARAGLREATGRAIYPGSGRGVPKRVGSGDLT